jgi:hypothetical protein
VFLLLGDVEKDLSWGKIKPNLKEVNKVQKRLVEFNVTDAPEARFERVKMDFMSDPDFNKEVLSKKARVAGSLFVWVEATLESYELMKNSGEGHTYVPKEVSKPAPSSPRSQPQMNYTNQSPA